MTKKTNSPSESAEVKKINSINFYFSWNSLQPDVRNYKPSNPLLTPDKPILVMVAVPIDPELIVNAQTIAIQQLSNQAESEPILTPLGMRYIIDQFEIAMSNQKEKETVESSDDDWGDEAENIPDEKAKKNDDEWEDETDQPGVDKPEENFDEDWS